MPKGDILARGGKQATFQQAQSASEFENDLKIQGREYVIEKYGLTITDHELYASMLKRGEALPDLQPSNDPGPVPDEAPEPVFMPAERPFPSAIEGLEALGQYEPEKPKFGYVADPAGDNLLIQRVEREHTSNLILPDSLKAKSEIGFVKAAGEAVKFYKAGDLVLFDKFASHGAEISLIDEDGIERQMLLMREYDVLTRLKKVPLSETSET